MEFDVEEVKWYPLNHALSGNFKEYLLFILISAISHLYCYVPDDDPFDATYKKVVMKGGVHPNMFCFLTVKW